MLLKLCFVWYCSDMQHISKMLNKVSSYTALVKWSCDLLVALLMALAMFALICQFVSTVKTCHEWFATDEIFLLSDINCKFVLIPHTLWILLLFPILVNIVFLCLLATRCIGLMFCVAIFIALLLCALYLPLNVLSDSPI